MKKLNKTKRKVKANKFHKVLVALAVILLMVVTFLIAGGVEGTKRAHQGYTVRHLYTREFDRLDNSLVGFGFLNTKSPASSCEYGEIYGYEGKPLLCAVTTNQYRVIGNDTNAHKDYVSKAKALDTALARNGWVTFSNSAKNFEDWMAAVTSGADYSTDIGSSANSMDGRCGIRMTVAYAKPAPVAINTELICNSPSYGDAGPGAMLLLNSSQDTR